MSDWLTLVILVVLAASRHVLASPCIAFDANFNLLVFGLNGKDLNVGPQESWTSANATDITISGRPPFDGSNTTCYLSQFTNAIYVLAGDSADPSAIGIYDASAKSWSTQQVAAGLFDPTSYNAILDHDTNVFYALTHGELLHLDMGSLTAAGSSSLSWIDVQKAPFPDNYQPVMVLAQNHIYFLDISGVPAGSAEIFVIHFSFFQPEPQSYPGPSGVTFPATHGQVTSFFQETGVQQQFAFIPDDGSATYIVDVVNNSTQVLPGPLSNDPSAIYFAGITSLVQLNSTGTVSFLPYEPGTASSNWSTILSIAVNPSPAVVGQKNSSGSAPTASGTASTANHRRKMSGIILALPLAAIIFL